ncbi:transglutaminase domain-containing protein [Neobacillus sp. YIM B06451]|uniref:transglutaminase domain-containing protein n=1 Tax=Neobacillus sp. YIM B06451 TaxID=3070994 RepID=UPI00292FA030|nr:transglutaminase domain-containing protein [Neobacillus sp. YIM B06451]
MKKLTALLGLLFFIYLLNPPAANAYENADCVKYYKRAQWMDAPTEQVVWWNGAILKKGQIGRLTILKNTPLYKVSGSTKTFVRTLKKGDFYRIYAFKPGLLSVGGGLYVERNEAVKYETPSKAKLEESYCKYELNIYDELEKKKAAIIKEAKLKKNDLAKILYVHDTLVNMIEYDEEGYAEIIRTNDLWGPYPVYHTALGALVFGKAYCDGYTYALNDILRELGITAYQVTSRPMAHSWSMVKLNGQYYHIDLTWADIGDEASYYNLLKSDEAIKAAGHYGWDGPFTDDGKQIKATSTIFNSLGQNMTYDDTQMYVFTPTNIEERNNYLINTISFASLETKQLAVLNNTELKDIIYHKGAIYAIERKESSDRILKYTTTMKLLEDVTPPGGHYFYRLFHLNGELYHSYVTNEGKEGIRKLQ